MFNFQSLNFFSYFIVSNPPVRKIKPTPLPNHPPPHKVWLWCSKSKSQNVWITKRFEHSGFFFKLNVKRELSMITIKHCTDADVYRYQVKVADKFNRLLRETRVNHIYYYFTWINRIKSNRTRAHWKYRRAAFYIYLILCGLISECPAISAVVHNVGEFPSKSIAAVTHPSQSLGSKNKLPKHFR